MGGRELVGVEPVEVDALRLRETDHLADDLVGLAERDAAADELLGEVGRQREPPDGRGGEPLASKVSDATVPVMAGRTNRRVSTASKTGSLSSCRSRS